MDPAGLSLLRRQQVVRQDARVSPVDTALLFGYVLVVPFTLVVPGFLRLWRRREVELLATVLVGLLVLTVAWLARDNAVVAALHAAALVALAVAWVRAGRRQVGTTAHASVL